MPENAQASLACPANGRLGRAVQSKTVKALLSFEALSRVHPKAEYYLCPEPACSVVYYDGEQIFTTQDVCLPVLQKDPGDSTLVCYCFGFTRGAVQADTRGAIAVAIAEHVKAGRCACDLRNPQGSCCLGNIRAITPA